MNQNFEIIENVEHGVVLRVADAALADQIDDFFTEECYVFYSTKFDKNFVEFYFGQLGCATKVRAIVEGFLKKLDAASSPVSP